MNNEITITLDRVTWVDLAKFLSKKIGDTVNPIPTILLLDALTKNGIDVFEMK